MQQDQSGSRAREGRLEEAIAAYLEARRTGLPLDQQSLIARYPELTESLAGFFADDAKIRRLIPANPAAARPDEAEALANESNPPRQERRQDSALDQTLDSPSSAPAQTRAPEGAPTVGETIRYFGDYELKEELAHGGMGVVFKARQASLNRVVALKMILSGQFASRADVQRFRSEAEAAAKLDHPNIVPIYEVGEHRGLHYYTMRLMDGGSLSARLGEFAVPAIDPRTGKDLAGTVWARPALRQRQDGIAAMLTTIAAAVHFAHQRGVLHRDLKPANILLDRNGAPHVTDFGIAKLLDVPDGTPAAAMTHTGAVLGTPAFMAPEQAVGKKGITTAADVYSLGAIFYQLLTSRPPFAGESALETLRQVQDRDPVAPIQVNPLLDRDLSTICLKCLQKDPATRYSSAEALGRDLERWRAGEPIVARPSTTAQRVVKWVRRRPAIAGLSAAIVVAAVAGFIAVVMAWRNAEVLRQAAANLAITEARAKEDAQRSNAAAQTARDSERQQRTNAEAALASANTNLYFDRIKLAYSAWTAGNMGDAETQLDACPKELRQWEWNYLERLCHLERMTLALPPGADTYLRYLDYSRDGKRLLGFGPYGSSSATVWDTTDGRIVRDISGRYVKSSVTVGQTIHLNTPSLELRSAALSADGKTVAIGSYDGSVDLWSVETGQPVRQLAKLKNPVVVVSLSSDGRLVAATELDQGARVSSTWVWPMAGGEPVFHRDNAYSHFNSDGTRLLVATRPTLAGTFLAPAGSVIQLFDTTTWKEALALGSADAMAFSGDGRKIALALRNRTGEESIRVINAVTGTELLTFRPLAYVADLAMNHDGSQIASAGDHAGGHLVWIWDGSSGALLATLRGHRAEVKNIAFSPDGPRLATSSDDGVVKIWDSRSSGEVTMLPSSMASYMSGVVMDHDLHLAVYAQAGAVNLFTRPLTDITLWDVRTGREGKSLRGHRAAPRALAMSPDGSRLISGSKDGTAHAWDTATGQSLFTFDAHGHNIEAVAISRDGRWAASAEEVFPTPPDRSTTIGPVRVWDIKTGRERSCYNGHDYGAGAVCFSPDGSYMVSAGYKTIRLWDPATGKERLAITSPATSCYLIVFTPDGRQFATAGMGNSDPERAVYLWDAASGKLLHTLSGHGSYIVKSIAFSPDGQRIATAAGNMVRICDCASGIEMMSLPGITQSVAHIAFSPDGHRLVAVSETGAMGYWDGTPR